MVATMLGRAAVSSIVRKETLRIVHGKFLLGWILLVAVVPLSEVVIHLLMVLLLRLVVLVV
jgi:hypothetical protein